MEAAELLGVSEHACSAAGGTAIAKLGKLVLRIAEAGADAAACAGCRNRATAGTVWRSVSRLHGGCISTSS